MAKQTKREKTAGRGKKECPKCGIIVGARAMTCDCGHEFTPKTAKRKQGGELTLSRITALIEQAGGISALKKALTDYEKVVAPIDSLGGYETAKSILEKVEAIKKL